jgi:hypothetical protein
MILLLTYREDVSVELVASHLRRKGADFLWLDYAQLPADAQLSFHCPAAGRVERLLHLDGRVYDLGKITAAWTHRPTAPRPDRRIRGAVEQGYVSKEALDFFNGVLETLDCLWVPAPRWQVWRGQYKPLQLQLAGELGFELPPTLMTNRPDDFLAFHRRHHGRLISKAVYNGCVPPGQTESPDAAFIFTEVVSGRDVGYAHAVRYCPVTFQPYVHKQLELRVTVVGGRVFAAAILSQDTNRTRYDWRHFDLYHTGHRPFELPADLERRCAELVRRLDLTFGAIDLILTPDGRYVFLEINPSGQWMWLEKQAGLPISEAIADLLMSRGPG